MNIDEILKVYRPQPIKLPKLYYSMGIIHSYISTPALAEIYSQDGAQQAITNLANSTGDGNTTGVRIESGHPGIGRGVKNIKLKINRTNNPDGNYAFEARTLNDVDIINETSPDVANSSLSTVMSMIEQILINTRVVEADDVFAVHTKQTNDNPNFVNHEFGSANSPSNTTGAIRNHTPAWTTYNLSTPYGIFDSNPP